MALRVFLVEDLVNMQVLMREACEALGDVEVLACATTEGEAKFWIQEHPAGWDVAVVDLMLESGSGIAVLPRCRELNPAGKVCVFSSYITPVLRDHCLRLGADAVFDKGQSAQFIDWMRQQAQGHAASQ